MRAIVVLGLVMRMAATVAAAPLVTFTGNDSFSSKELRTQMPSVADQEQLDRSLLYLSAFYWDRGYANVRVSDAPWARSGIAIAIEEGPKFTIGSVRVIGHEELLETLWVRPDATFSHTRIAEDRETLATFYQDQGYAFVNVLPLTHVDMKHATIDLTFEIELGKRARFGRFTIYNAPVDVVRRELGIGEGEQFSETKLTAGKRRLIARGFTDIVIATKHGAKDDLVDVIVELPSN